MKNIRYIGKKVRKVDTFAGTGIIWNGVGDVQPVPDTLAARFLEHTDSFVLADDVPAAAADPATAKASKVAERESESPPLVNLESMDGKALRDYAQRYFGETFHPKTGEAKMRQAIVGMMNRG